MQTVDKHNKKHNLSYMLSKLLAIVLVAATLFTTVDLTSIRVYADVEGEAELGDRATYSGNGKWLGTYGYGMGYKGQGVLMYLIDAHTCAGVPGTQPVAYYCDNIARYQLKAMPKVDGTYDPVTTWTSMAPWKDSTPNRGGIMNGAYNSNIEAIKTWLLTPTGEMIEEQPRNQGIALVETVWGLPVAEKFAKKELLLVMEPIICVQPASYKEDAIARRAGRNLDDWLDNPISVSGRIGNLVDALSAVSYDWQLNTPDSVGRHVNGQNKMNGYMVDSLRNKLYILKSANTGGWYSFVSALNKLRNNESMMKEWRALATALQRTSIYKLEGEPFCGTSKACIQYQLFDLEVTSGWSKTCTGSIYFRVNANRSTSVVEPSAILAGTPWATHLVTPAERTLLRQGKVDDTLIGTKTCGMLVMNAFGNSTTTTPDIQTTCNESSIPNPHPAPPESTGECIIIKTYRTKTGATYQDDGTYYYEPSAEKILIENEGSGDDHYQVINWRETNRLAPEGSIHAATWTTDVPGTIKTQGTSGGTTVEMHTTAGYKYLYILLEKSEDETVNDANYTLTQAEIARGVRLSKPDVTAATGNTMRDVSTLTFTWARREFTWSCSHKHYGGDCQASAFTCSNRGSHGHCTSSCSNCSGSSTSPCSEGHTSPTKHHGTHDTYYYCNGHDCTNWDWSDNSIDLVLKNSKATTYPNVVATKTDWNSIVVTTTTLTKWHQAYTDENATRVNWKNQTNLDILAVLMRGADKLTVAEWKNEAAGTTANTDLKDLSSSGFSVANTPQGTRKTADYNETFLAQFDSDSDSADLHVNYKAGYCEVSNSHTTSGINKNWALTLPGAPEERQVKATVHIKVYSGSAGSCSVDDSYDDSEMITAGSSGNLVKSGRMIRLDGSTVTTYPYIQMFYTTRNSVHADGSRGTLKDAYVLGQFERSFMLNAYAEIEWRKTANANLTLESLQWSTHKMVQDAGFGFGEVLPGGATLNLTIKDTGRRSDTSRQIVTVITYNPILAGAGKDQVEKTGHTVPEALEFEKAKEEHGKYVLSVIDGLSSLTFEQWYKPSYVAKTSGNLWDSSVGGFIVKSGMTNPCRTSSESKYYFVPITHDTDGSLATEGDLDADVYKYGTYDPVGIKDSSDQTNDIYNASDVVYMTFWVDTDGNVRVASGHNLDTVANTPKGNPRTGGEIVARRVGTDCNIVTGSGSSVVSSALELNRKTFIIEKLIDAFEKGGGQDSFAKTGGADGGWYNEAFDGVTYAIVKTELLVGFADPGERSTVLDPLLCPPNDRGQAGMFQPSNPGDPLTSGYYTSQYKLMDTTNGYSEQYKIGVYREKDIKMNQFDYLFYSDKFWIPNVTVQDLK